MCAGLLAPELTSVRKDNKFDEDYGYLRSLSLNVGNSRGSIVELGSSFSVCCGTFGF